MTKKIIWDCSTSKFLFQADEKKVEVEFKKKELSTKLPLLIQELQKKLQITKETEIFAGSGPGSFTSIKTGNGFLISWLYALGVEQINVISSLEIISSFYENFEGLLHFVIQPFNSTDFFVSIYNFKNKKKEFLEQDLKISKEDLLNFVQKFKDLKIVFVSTENKKLQTLQEDVKKLGKEIIFSKEKDCDFSLLKHSKKINILSEPLIFNYVVSPANLKISTNEVYINYNKEQV